MPNCSLIPSTPLTLPSLISTKPQPCNSKPFLKINCTSKRPASNKRDRKNFLNDWKVIKQHIQENKGEPQREVAVCKSLKQAVILYAPTLLGLSSALSSSQSSTLASGSDAVFNQSPDMPLSSLSSLNLNGPAFTLNGITDAVTHLWNKVPTLLQWPPGAGANPITNPELSEFHPTDNILFHNAPPATASNPLKYASLAEYFAGKEVFIYKDELEHSAPGRYNRALDNRNPPVQTETWTVAAPSPDPDSAAVSVYRWGDKQMHASQLLLNTYRKGTGGGVGLAGAVLTLWAGALAHLVSQIIDGTVVEREPYETKSEHVLRIVNNLILPPEGAASRAFRVGPSLLGKLRPMPSFTRRAGVKVVHETSGLTHMYGIDNKNPTLHLKIQNKYYPVTHNIADDTLSLANAHKVYFNQRTGELREFWTGNSHLTAKSLSAIPDELLTASPGDNSILAFGGQVSAEGKVWTVPQSGKYYLEVLKRDPVNPNKVISEYVEGHLEERFFSIKQDALSSEKQPLLEWKPEISKWEPATQVDNILTATFTAPAFKDLPLRVLVSPSFKFEQSAALLGFKNVYRSETGDIFIHTGNTRRGVAQYIQVVQEEGNKKLFNLEIPDSEGHAKEIQIYRYDENGKITLDEVVNCLRVKRGDDNPCLAGHSGEGPAAKRARITLSPQQAVEEKLAEIESNPLEWVPINRAGEHDVLHDLAIEAIRTDYHQKIMNNVPVEQLTDIFKAQARTARIISEFYTEQPIKGSVAGAREYSYILLDKLLSTGAFKDNLMVFDLTINGEVKHTALLYYPEHNIREVIVTPAPFFTRHVFSMFELSGAIKAIKKPFAILNPWSAENKILTFEIGTKPMEIQQQFIGLMHEAGVSMGDKSIQKTQGLPVQNNRLFLESIKINLPESIVDPLSSMEQQEKEYLNYLASDNYRIRARGESVLNEPAGINRDIPLTLRDQFISARAIIDEIDKLDGPIIDKFVAKYFGDKNLAKKTEIFKLYLVNAKSNLARYYSGGDRLGKLVLLEPNGITGENFVAAFVSDGEHFTNPPLAIVDSPFWKSTRLNGYVKSVRTLMHEVSHIIESNVPAEKTPLKAFDFIYNGAEFFNLDSNHFNYRMDYYSAKENNYVLPESNEANLKLMKYDEYFVEESKESDSFNLIEDRGLFERKLIGELNRKVKVLEIFLQENEKVILPVNVIQSKEHSIHRLFKEINSACERLGIPQRAYDTPPLTHTYNPNQTKRQLNDVAIYKLHEWIYEIAKDKEIRAAVVLNNADSIAYYQMLLAAKNKGVAKHLINEGRLDKPNPDLPWEASDDEASDVESSDK